MCHSLDSGNEGGVMDRIERLMYDAIHAEPGLHPGEYVRRVPAAYTTATAAARRLLAAGLVIRTGNTRNIRYWPATSTDPGAEIDGTTPSSAVPRSSIAS